MLVASFLYLVFPLNLLCSIDIWQTGAAITLLLGIQNVWIIQAPYIIYYDYSWISFDMQSGVDAIISFRNE